MGTRCLTVLKDDDGTEIAVLYRQYDGYVRGGHGEELVEYVKGFAMTNGLRGPNCPNGGGCLAAMVVAHFKATTREGVACPPRPGDFYLYPAGTRNVGEEYVYTVTPGKSGAPVLVEVETTADNRTRIWPDPVPLGEGIQ